MKSKSRYYYLPDFGGFTNTSVREIVELSSREAGFNELKGFLYLKSGWTADDRVPVVPNFVFRSKIKYILNLGSN